MASRKSHHLDHLTESSRLWCESIEREFELDSHHRLLLQAAAESWDAAQAARQIVARDGRTVVDRYQQIKPHPMLAEERQNKVVFARLIRELGLDVEPPKESRPPRHGGQKW